MSKVYRTSRGEAVDMDMLRLSNENIIAVGNMKVNARGDELGHGGKVLKSRAQVMQQYHKLNTPVADNSPVTKSTTEEQAQNVSKLKTPIADSGPVTKETAATEYVKPRGSFAGAVAEQTEVKQELSEPAALRNPGSQGVTRI